MVDNTSYLLSCLNLASLLWAQHRLHWKWRFMTAQSMNRYITVQSYLEKLITSCISIYFDRMSNETVAIKNNYKNVFMILQNATYEDYERDFYERRSRDGVQSGQTVLGTYGRKRLEGRRASHSLVARLEAVGGPWRMEPAHRRTVLQHSGRVTGLRRHRAGRAGRRAGRGPGGRRRGTGGTGLGISG